MGGPPSVKWLLFGIFACFEHWLFSSSMVMLVACSVREVFGEVLVYLCAVLYGAYLCLNLYLYLRWYSAARVWFTEGLWEVVESEPVATDFQGWVKIFTLTFKLSQRNGLWGVWQNMMRKHILRYDETWWVMIRNCLKFCSRVKCSTHSAHPHDIGIQFFQLLSPFLC